MLRVLSDRQKFKVNVLMFSRHVAQVTSFFERLHPEGRLRVIQMDPGSIRSIFEVKACIDRGEFVGILGDRIRPGELGRVADDFLGAARFPLARSSWRDCSAVLLTLCLRTGDARYETVVKLLTQGEVVPRAEREKRAQELLETYARSLEEACCRAPYQWFNFYDFWDAHREAA
jgi:predicted LPLAT superfamily acyltransferase